MNRFRPNVVIDGVDAYGEDAIRELHAGQVALKLVKACTRSNTLASPLVEFGLVMNENAPRSSPYWRSSSTVSTCTGM